jgi:hypothetical protein
MPFVWQSQLAFIPSYQEPCSGSASDIHRLQGLLLFLRFMLAEQEARHSWVGPRALERRASQTGTHVDVLNKECKGG